MIEEKGTILEITGEGLALIKTEKNEACDGCGSKEICRSVGESDMVVEAENPVNARVGDEVVFTVAPVEMLRAGALLYLIPLIGFIAGVVLGQVAVASLAPSWNADLLSAALGFLFVALAFGGVKIYTGTTARESAMRPKIIRITKAAG
ncbi:MAG: SoxR reducing system RseC family protein [Thermodesulfobacteriota bacterium]